VGNLCPLIEQRVDGVTSGLSVAAGTREENCAAPALSVTPA